MKSQTFLPLAVPQLHVIFAPWTSTSTFPALAAVSPYNATLMAPGASSPAIFTGAYPYVYGFTAMANSGLTGPFNTIFSRIPIVNVIIAYRTDSFSSTVAAYLQAAFTSNAFTSFNLTANIVNVSLQVLMPTPTVDLYTSFFNTYLDTENPVDLFVLAGQLNDFDAAVVGLQNSEMNPKGCLFITTFPDTDPVFNLQAEGWMSVFAWDVTLNFNSTLPNAVFSSTRDLNTKFQAMFGASAVLGSSHVQSISALEALIAAINVSQAVDAPSLKTGLLQLNGYTVFSRFKLDPVQLFNGAQMNALYQLKGGSNLPILQVDDLVYPAVWPWMKLSNGDQLPFTVDGPYQVLGLVLFVFGAWVGLILMEQVVYMRNKGQRLGILWFLFCGLSVGVSAVWASSIVNVAALSIACPLCLNSFSISYSLDVLLLALLVSLLLTLAGFGVVIFWLPLKGSDSSHVKPASNMHSSTSRGSVTKQTTASGRSPRSSSLSPASASRRSKADTSFVPGIARMTRTSVLFGGACLSLSIVLCRVVAGLSLVGNATVKWSIAGDLVAPFILFVLCSIAIAVYAYSTRYRPAGAFILASAYVIDSQMNFNTMAIAYSRTSASALAHNALPKLASPTIMFIAAIFGGVSGIVFIALQFNKMKLSHHALALAMLKLQHRLDDWKAKYHQAITSLRNTFTVALELNQILEAINLVRPYDGDAVLSPQALHLVLRHL